MTKIKSANDLNAIKEAARIITEGGLVAFPTETVYGLGADALNSEACKGIFEAKGRPRDNPLIIHIADMESLLNIVEVPGHKANKLMEKFWPGPLTLIFTKKTTVSDVISGGLSTVAVRMPDNEAALSLIKEAKTPIAAPSANISGRPSPTTAGHVKSDLDGKIDMILDGGNAVVGLESTIVDLSGTVPMLLRPGAITLEMLEDILGTVEIYPEIIFEDDKAPKAPGMKYRHYAPKAELTVVISKRKARISKYIRQKIGEIGGTCAILASQEDLEKYKNLKTYSLEPETLFAALRQIDKDGIKRVFVHGLDDTGINRAMMNRLRKASSGDIVDLDTVLFVCTGNTCRSPMAEAIWDSFKTGCLAKSCGIAVAPGSTLNENARKTLEIKGLSLQGFTSRQLTKNDVEEASVIFCMTKVHAEYVKQMTNDMWKVYTLSEYAGESETDISDPFGSELDIYEVCAKELETLISKIIENRNKKSL
ncbi:MAG: L-threonylcarbamoyladenylate synthase [Defluviitaleaceae bacterium]|nr:L-threonylcarbamoyladenylate synthase [Defluviitaleaceae bacterium]